MPLATPTMRRRRRFGTLILALLQLGASTAVVSADAMLDGEMVGHAIHMESEGSEECATHHDHLFCQVVRTLTTPVGTAPASVDPTARLRITATLAAAHESEIARPTLLSGTVGSRAPPLG